MLNKLAFKRICFHFILFCLIFASLRPASAQGFTELWTSNVGNFVVSVSYSPDGKRIVSGDNGGHVRVWDAASGEEQWESKNVGNTVVSVSYSPDGKRIVSGDWTDHVRVWDAASGEEQWKSKDVGSYVWSVSYSPDGKRIVSGDGYYGNSGHVRVWDAASGEEQWKSKDVGSFVNSVSYSPDGKRIVSGDETQHVRVWDAVSGKELWKSKDVGAVFSVTYSPDGKRIVSGDDTNHVRVWDAMSGEELWKSKDVGSYVRSVSYSPDGKRIVSGDGTKHVRVWISNKAARAAAAAHAAQVQKAAEAQANQEAARIKTMEEIGVVIALFLLLVTWRFVLKRKNRPQSAATSAAPASTAPSSLTKPPSTAETVASSGQTREGQSTALIAGKYELLRQIGQGGMGLVYEAKDHSLGRRVAIKKMRPEVAMNPKEKARFLDEAKIVAQLRHPSIVDIHEIIEESNEVYLVFEYVEGQNLAEMIAKHGKLAAAEMGSVLGGVCRALAFAHSKKVIHRDLKPSNIMVTKAEGAKVMDFGIAGQALDAMSRVSRVETAGTFAYMSPEQHLGKWDARSDIYSLGATIYEALTGDIPFRGPDFLAQKERSVFKPLTEILPDCNVRLNEIIVRCLKPDPKERFQTIEEFARAAGV
jgi:tRNA A-37 threonylcarbamoyl transferase component Bud32